VLRRRSVSVESILRGNRISIAGPASPILVPPLPSSPLEDKTWRLGNVPVHSPSCELTDHCETAAGGSCESPSNKCVLLPGASPSPALPPALCLSPSLGWAAPSQLDEGGKGTEK
jgi:hypothetical protein